ncbi:MAG: electron transport complex subunit RsxA [Peptostreptococcaceae bacterium]|nr:electron transport complex subunit RsxA [Peptostreptococcaceae bacterium]
MKEIFIILLSSIFVNNFVMSKFLGICPFLGVSKKIETAMGMGMAVTFVMVLASIITWILQRLLIALDIRFMQTIVFILVIAALVQLVEMIIQKLSPTLYQALGVFLPLITTNCAVLGVAILNIQNDYNLIQTIFNGAGAALGFTLSIVLFAGIRERLELSDIPESFQGYPIALITAGIMSVAFLGFTGLVK